MEKLEIKKVYIDTRFKTGDSKSDSEFNIELPKTFNIPADTICFVDDVAIPTSWAVVSDRNNKLYFDVEFDSNTYYFMVTLDTKNYNGTSFVEELQNKMNSEVTSFFEPDRITFQLTYDVVDNSIVISFTDLRSVRTTVMSVTLYSNTSLLNGMWNSTVVHKPQSINDNIRLTNNYTMVEAFSYESNPVNPFESQVNLHTIRNLYLLSSSLSNYDTVSNFGIDTIVKKIPIRANFNEMIFDNASEGFDYISVSPRTLQRIDFKLVDSYGSTIDLRNNHWSFSLVFQRTN